MNNTTDDKPKTLQDLNTSIKEFNANLEEIIQLRQKDKLEWLKTLNTNFRQVNTVLAELLESRKKDALTNELRQTKQ
jgi:hypothetical protein